MNNHPDRITISHEAMLGKPVIRGTRLTVEFLLRKVSEGATATNLLQMYSQLEAADAEAILAFASAILGEEKTIVSKPYFAKHGQYCG